MKYLYCPQCAAPLRQQTKTEYICQNNHPYWNNPRVAASIIIVKGDKLLIAKRGAEPYKGKFDIPGGFLEYNENPETAAKREILEETSLKIDNLELISVYTHEYDEQTSVCDLVYIAHKWHGKVSPHDDVAALDWKPFSIIDDKDFTWPYPGLVAKLTNIS